MRIRKTHGKVQFCNKNRKVCKQTFKGVQLIRFSSCTLRRIGIFLNKNFHWNKTLLLFSTLLLF